MPRTYTRANLKEDVEDLATKFGYSPDFEARFASGALELKDAGVSYQRLAPNKRAPFGHRHKRQEELYVILSGSGRAALDDEVIEVEPLDALRVPPSTARCFEAGPEGLEVIAFGSPRTGDSAAQDVEMLGAWWPE